MTVIDELLDQAARAAGARNDTELAHALHVKPAAVSNYRRGVSLPNAIVCERLATLARKPLKQVLGHIGEARAISSEEKAVWRKLATAAALFLALFPAQIPPAQAHILNDTTPYTLCAVLKPYAPFR